MDADGDGHGAGTAVTICGGATVPAGYSTSNDDGCPNDPTKTARVYAVVESLIRTQTMMESLTVMIIALTILIMTLIQMAIALMLIIAPITVMSISQTQTVMALVMYVILLRVWGVFRDSV